MTTIELDGATEIIRGLEGLTDLAPLVPTLEQIGSEVRERARQYPPELPNQRYVRTETLKRGWRVEDAVFIAGMVTVEVTNAVEYAPFVQGDDQKFIHKGRWETDTLIAERMADDALNAVERGVESWLRQVMR